LHGDRGESADAHGDLSGAFHSFLASLNGVLFLRLTVEEFLGGEGWYDVFVEESVGERRRREEELTRRVRTRTAARARVGVTKRIVDAFEAEEVSTSDQGVGKCHPFAAYRALEFRFHPRRSVSQAFGNELGELISQPIVRIRIL
jgi:hypothetical protein